MEQKAKLREKQKAKKKKIENNQKKTKTITLSNRRLKNQFRKTIIKTPYEETISEEK